METLDPIEFGWLVGILEGEGCFVYEENGQRWRHARIVVGMVDEDVVRRVHDLLPGSRYTVSNPPSRKALGNQPLHVVRCNGKLAIQVMEQVLPYMGERRAARIHEIIRQYKTDRSL